MKNLNTIEKLNSLIGEEVSILAGDDCQDEPGIHFQLRGKLESKWLLK